MYRIEKYNTDYFKQWNDFISYSKNGTFLFHRDFMEYHSDRFYDYSLLIFEEEKLLAVLPAHLKENVLFSHFGLTYGGLVYTEKLRQAEVITIFKFLLQFLNKQNIIKLYIKTIPYIYHKIPAQELEYVLFVTGAQLVRRDSLSVIENTARIGLSRHRRQSANRGVKKGLVIKEETEFELFWNEILMPNLDTRHNVKPVHTVAEIKYLHSKFPENIRHFNVYDEDKIVAGTTVFITDTVAHPQYISGNADKNELGSLDYLYRYLIEQIFVDKKYFDFGISNEEQGKKLNQGLSFWKETFGARTVVHDFYEVDTGNYSLLDRVLI